MSEDRLASRIGRIVGVVIVEYLVLVGLLYVAIRFLGTTASQTANVAAVLFGAFTLLNFFVAHRVQGGHAPRTLARHLGLLRDDFLYLRWYFDEILETMSSAVIVLDRMMTVRSMNHAGRNLLSLREKEELVGRPFRFHPLSQEVYGGEVYTYRQKALLEVLEMCAREGSSVLLEKIDYRRNESAGPISLDILIYPWKNRQDETERLVLRLDEPRANGEPEPTIDLEKILAAAPPPPPEPLEDRSVASLRKECGGMRDHLNALLDSSRSIGQVVGDDEKGPRAELLLFEMQVKRILDMLSRMETELGRKGP